MAIGSGTVYSPGCTIPSVPHVSLGVFIQLPCLRKVFDYILNVVLFRSLAASSFQLEQFFHLLNQQFLGVSGRLSSQLL